MIDKSPVFYDPVQQSEVLQKLNEVFRGGEMLIAHEKTSEYVHSDVAVFSSQDIRVYASFGMGARDMYAPFPGGRRAELVMFALNDLYDEQEDLRLANEVVSMTKFPFANATWLGDRHTVEATDSFTEHYGYEAFLLLEYPDLATTVSDIGEVHFLAMLPLYKEERDWIIDNGSPAFLKHLIEEYGDHCMLVNFERPVCIPADV